MSVLASRPRFLVGFFVAFLALRAGELPAAEPPVSAEVEKALRLELAGQNAERNALLSELITANPDDAAARWQLGYVRMDKAWLKPDEVADQMSADARLAEYRTLRQQCQMNAVDQVALARWCRKAGLKDEERFHWLCVLQLQPDHREATDALEKFRAEAIQAGKAERRELAAQWQQMREQRKLSQAAQKQWEERIEQWVNAIRKGDEAACETHQQAARGLNAYSDLDGLLRAFTRSLANASRQSHDAYRELSLSLVKVLAENDSPFAPAAIACLAADSPWTDVRKAAGEHLRDVRQSRYVPVLLALMDAPLEMSFSINVAAGFVNAQSRIYHAGPAVDDVVSIEYRQRSVPGDPADPHPNPTDLATAMAGSMARAKLASASIAAQRAQVDQINAKVQARNQRIAEILNYATSAKLPPSAEKWWAWWEQQQRDYYEYDRSHSERRVRERWYGYTETCRLPYRSPTRPPVNTIKGSKIIGRVEGPDGRRYWQREDGTLISASCFAPGTPVWTLNGPMPIEKIQIGDRVLSQNPATGELAYKLVLAVTTRDPTPRIAIGIGSETINATRGHPFWIVGEGWSMAKQLQAGQALHAIDGAVNVDQVEEREAAKEWYDFSHNLVVEDFHTYFVGQAKLLVHDNTLAWTTDQRVLPGMEAEVATQDQSAGDTRR